MFHWINQDVGLKGISEWSGQKKSDQWGCEKTGSIFCISREEMEELKIEMKKSKNGEVITRKNPKGEVVLNFKNPIVPKTRNQMNDPHKFLCIRCLNKTGKKCPIEKHLHVKNFTEEMDKQIKRKNLETKAAKKSRALVSNPKKAPSKKASSAVSKKASSAVSKKASVFKKASSAVSKKACSAVSKHYLEKQNARYTCNCNNICCFMFGNGSGLCRRNHSTIQEDICKLWFESPNLESNTGGLWHVRELLWTQRGRVDDDVSFFLKTKGTLFDRYLKVFAKTSTLLCQKIDSVNGMYNSNAWVPNERPRLDFALHGNGAINTYFKKMERRDQDKMDLIRDYLRPMVRGFCDIFKNYILKDGSIVSNPKRSLPSPSLSSEWSEKKSKDISLEWKTTQKGKSYRDMASGTKNNFPKNESRKILTNDSDVVEEKKMDLGPYEKKTTKDCDDLLSPKNFFLNRGNLPMFTTAWPASQSPVSPSTTESLSTPPGFNFQSEINLIKNQKKNLEIENESLREKLRMVEMEKRVMEESNKCKEDTKRVIIGTIIGKITMMSDSKNWDAKIINELLKLQ